MRWTTWTTQRQRKFKLLRNLCNRQNSASTVGQKYMKKLFFAQIVAAKSKRSLPHNSQTSSSTIPIKILTSTRLTQLALAARETNGLPFSFASFLVFSALISSTREKRQWALSTSSLSAYLVLAGSLTWFQFYVNQIRIMYNWFLQKTPPRFG